MTQRNYMRMLYQMHGNFQDILVREYAAAEIHGIVTRNSNNFDLSAEQYAVALYRDGVRKGWIIIPPIE